MSGELLQNDYAWMFDLVVPDPGVRGPALARHQALAMAVINASHRRNWLWARSQRAVSSLSRLTAEWDQANADLVWHEAQMIDGPIGAFLQSAPGDEVAETLWAPFAVLYLQWEASYPAEWGAPESRTNSPWTTKELILRRFDRYGVPDDVRSPLAELVVSACSRTYRCKDWGFAGLVRHLDVSSLDAVTALVSADDPLVRLRARFVLHAAETRDPRIRRASWQRWLDAAE